MLHAPLTTSPFQVEDRVLISLTVGTYPTPPPITDPTLTLSLETSPLDLFHPPPPTTSPLTTPTELRRGIAEPSPRTLARTNSVMSVYSLPPPPQEVLQDQTALSAPATPSERSGCASPVLSTSEERQIPTVATSAQTTSDSPNSCASVSVHF